MDGSDTGGSNGNGFDGTSGESIVLIPFGAEFLAMTPENLAKALSVGRVVTGNTQHSGTATPSQETLLDADGMNQLTGVPASWFLEQARQDKIPHLRVGKYVRFRPGDVLPTLEAGYGRRASRSTLLQKISVG